MTFPALVRSIDDRLSRLFALAMLTEIAAIVISAFKTKPCEAAVQWRAREPALQNCKTSAEV
jgi:hypothetical protein